MKPAKIAPKPGQESVWDYPRPPRAEPTSKHVQVVLNGITIADTRRAIRVLETSHPPVYYIPMEDIQGGVLEKTARQTFCEFKGRARYFTVQVGNRRVERAAWYYSEPERSYELIRDCVAFYPGLMDACFVDGEQVRAQPGDFYGGWITSEIVGPFKGEPGTSGW
jgi:uncharacterized protein (DUF427 family)